MPDVPNLSILTPPKEKPMKEIAPRHRLGHLIRNRRNVLKKSLREVTHGIATALGNNDFTDIVLGEIERGVRPATMEELEAISHVLDVGIDLLSQHAVEWHESVWEEHKPRYELQPGETSAATIHTMSHVEAMDELRGAIADMRRGIDELHRAEDAMRKLSDFDLASDFKHTAALLEASVCRIETRLGKRWERVKANFASDEDA